MSRISGRPYVLLAAFTPLKDVVEHFEVLDTLEVEVDLRTRRGTPEAHGPYDLIVQMGLGDAGNGDKKKGLEFFRALRQRFPGVPILVVSRHDDSYERAEVCALGAAGYLKRDNADELDRFAAKIRELLDAKTAPR